MLFSSDHTGLLLDLLRWRRDVRRFRLDSLAPGVLDDLERAMAHAPSVGNSRPWRVIKVESSQARDVIIASHEAANAVAAQDYDDERRHAYLALKLAGLKEAPVHLAVFTDMSPAAGQGLGRQTMPETLLYSTVIAIHTLWLVARSMNVGVGWVSILEPETVAHCLSTPETWHFTAYLCLGYPEDDHQTPELDRLAWQRNDEPPWMVR